MFNHWYFRQEVDDDLSVCVLNIQQPTKFINYKPRESRDIFFKTVMWPNIGHLIKGSCLGASYTKLAPCLCCIHTSSAGGDIYFICHVTPQDHSVEMSWIHIGESSLQHVTTLKSLVIIDVLIVKKKNASSKTQILYICTATEKLSWLDNR